MQKNTKSLPAIPEWDGHALVTINEEVEIMKLLNEKPHAKAIKRNKFANDAAYLPIGLIEAQLDRFFGALNWSFVVSKLEIQFNAITCVGELIIFYKDRQIRRSGVGSCEIQMRSGSTGMNPENIASKAMERDAPKAKSQALKNAAESLGDAFGRSLNRDYNHGYVEHKAMNELRGGIVEHQDMQELERMRKFIEGAKTLEQLDNIDVPEELRKEWENRREKLKKPKK